METRVRARSETGAWERTWASTGTRMGAWT